MPATALPPPVLTPPKRASAAPLWAALRSWLLPVVAFAVIVWSFRGLQFDFSHLATGIQRQSDQLRHLFPHTRADWRYDLSVGRDLWQPFLTTIQMAVVGTTVGALLAFPVSFLAARTGYVPRPVSALVKTLLNVARSVPTIVYALVAVSFIGLGPSAGQRRSRS